MTKEEERERAVKAILALTAEDLTKAYSGKPGCGCGCRGNYYEDLRGRRRVLTAMKKGLANASTNVTYEPGLGDETVAAVESETRNYWAYL